MLQGRQYGYSYDNNGNQIAKSINETKGWIQSWDYENRLITSERTKGAEKRTISFKYDPFGRRIEKKLVTTNPASTETTTYVYDNEDIVLELTTDSTGTTKTFYTHGPGIDEPLAMERSGQYYYYHQDGLGSITAITDQSRTVVQRYSYSVFGQPRPTTNFRNSYQYTGREYDKETGLYYYRLRYYDPMEGRFISKDPIGFEGGDVNLFGYVQNNPINATDPIGLTNFFVRPWWSLFRFPRLGPPPPPANWPKPPNWAPEWQWKYPECSTPKTQPRWFDPNGGEWRWHSPDKWHPDGHWDYNPWDSWNSPWRNIYPSVPVPGANPPIPDNYV